MSGESIFSKIREKIRSRVAAGPSAPQRGLLALAVFSASLAPAFGSGTSDSTERERLQASELALGLYTYALVPAMAALSLVTISSPGYLMEFDRGRLYHGFTAGTGLGLSFGDTVDRYPELYFSNARLQAEFSYIPEHPSAPRRLGLTALADWNALPVLKKELFRLGGSAGAGFNISEDIPRYHLQAELWIKNAMGLRYLGLSPEHTLFLRTRWYAPNQRHEAGLGFAVGYAATYSFRTH